MQKERGRKWLQKRRQTDGKKTKRVIEIGKRKRQGNFTIRRYINISRQHLVHAAPVYDRWSVLSEATSVPRLT
jgi:hypothetical protein